MPTPAWIGLGSNLGDRRSTLDSAVVALDEDAGLVVTAVSSYRETSPVGGPPGQGAFLNAVARVETTLTPFELLAATRAIEDRAGRVRSVRWGERTLDLDLLIFGSTFLDGPELRLPHPRLALRRFALGPLAEISPEAVEVVTMRSAADLLANLDREPRSVGWVGDPAPALVRRLEAAIGRDGWGTVDFGRSSANPPTFLVALPGSPLSRRPGLAPPVPVLWPESDDPDAIVAEVVATARAISGV